LSLAPIGLSTYSRLLHLKQTIEALKANTLAKESDLYIFKEIYRYNQWIQKYSCD
jgi:hypothetical protein